MSKCYITFTIDDSVLEIIKSFADKHPDAIELLSEGEIIDPARARAGKDKAFQIALVVLTAFINPLAEEIINKSEDTSTTFKIESDIKTMECRTNFDASKDEFRELMKKLSNQINDTK